MPIIVEFYVNLIIYITERKQSTVIVWAMAMSDFYLYKYFRIIFINIFMPKHIFTEGREKIYISPI